MLDDIGAGAAKTGMLFSSAIIEAVADELAGRGLPLVVDPVMMASSGARLLLPDAVATLTGRLFPLATVVTPNLPEAQALTGLDTEDRAALAERLVAMGAAAALVTGGHGAQPGRPPLRRAPSPVDPGPAATTSPPPTAPAARTPRRSRRAWRRASPSPTRPRRRPRSRATPSRTAWPASAAATDQSTRCTVSCARNQPADRARLRRVLSQHSGILQIRRVSSAP